MRNPSALGAVKQARKLAAAQLKGHYSDWLAGMLILVLIRLAALLPLLALFVFEKGDPMQFLALLTPLIYLFVILPLRFSAGGAMRHALGGSPFATAGLLSFQGYGKRLKAMFMQALHLLSWALPLLLGLAAVYYLKDSNSAVVLRAVKSLGKLLGDEYGFQEGMYMVAAFGGLLLLVLLFGMMRNGMLRFVWKASDGDYRTVRREMLKRLKGRRMGQFLIGLVQSILVLPVLLLEAYLGYRMWRHNAFVPDLFLGMAGGIFLLYWPLLPLRKALQAAYICSVEELK